MPDDLTLEETEIRDAAIAYARKQGKKIAKGLTDPAVYKPDPNPVSVFMAGSPGAGKQEPALAWEFVRAREELEGRNIKPADFVDQYFAARQVVNALKVEFAKEIQIDLILKNRDNSTKVYKDNIDKIDNHVPEKYTREQVGEIVKKAAANS